MEFYGYKKCSTCRSAFQYLKDLGWEIDFHDFVAVPPATPTLLEWVSKRGGGVAPFINTKGTRFRELGLKGQNLTEEEWVSMLATDGKLIKRPVVIHGDTVLIGFDKSAYDALALKLASE